MSARPTHDVLKLTTYFGERKRFEGRLVADVLLDLYEQHNIATSALFRGVEGFGPKHHLRTDSSLSLSEDLPAVAVAIDEPESIEQLAVEVVRITGGGSVTLERARRFVADPDQRHPVALPDPLHEATKLTVYLGRQQRIDGRVAFVALCDLLRQRGVAGASALLGVDGTVDGRRTRARFFARNSDVPVMVIAVGSGERIAAVLPEISALLPGAFTTLERVRVCKRDGQLFTRPAEAPQSVDDADPRWQKLMVYTSESQLHDGQPIHRTITRRLRASGARGSTTLRGVWGFHGDHAPHGDVVLTQGRRVPVVTVVIDSPDRIQSSFDIIDELTAEHGLVTCELVPTLR